MKVETSTKDDKVLKILKEIEKLDSRYKVEYKNYNLNCYKIKIKNQSKSSINIILFLYCTLICIIYIMYRSSLFNKYILLHGIVLTILIYIKTQMIEYESITIYSQIGIQLTTKRLFKKTIFIPIENINNIYILEGFYRFQVRFYLAILINQKQSELVPVFRNLLPELNILKITLRISRHLLMNEEI